MTREQAQQLAANPVWQGFLAGRQVEYMTKNGQWVPDNDVTAGHMASHPDRYRLKPEPRRFWLNHYGNHLTAHFAKERADKHAAGDRKECIEVVEVLPQPASQPPAEQPQAAPKAIRRWAVLDDSGSFLGSFTDLEDAQLRATGNRLIVGLTSTYTPKGGSQ